MSFNSAPLNTASLKITLRPLVKPVRPLVKRHFGVFSRGTKVSRRGTEVYFPRGVEMDAEMAGSEVSKAY